VLPRFRVGCEPIPIPTPHHRRCWGKYPCTLFWAQGLKWIIRFWDVGSHLTLIPKPSSSSLLSLNPTIGAQSPNPLPGWGSRFSAWSCSDATSFSRSESPTLRFAHHNPHIGLRLKVVHRVSSSLLGPVVPSFRALSGRLKFTVKRSKVVECIAPKWTGLYRRSPKRKIRNPKTENRNAKPGMPKPQTHNPKPHTRQTLNLETLNPQMERIFVELMTSDRKLEASREGSK